MQNKHAPRTLRSKPCLNWCSASVLSDALLSVDSPSPPRTCCPFRPISYASMCLWGVITSELLRRPIVFVVEAQSWTDLHSRGWRREARKQDCHWRSILGTWTATADLSKNLEAKSILSWIYILFAFVFLANSGNEWDVLWSCNLLLYFL